MRSCLVFIVGITLIFKGCNADDWGWIAAGWGLIALTAIIDKLDKKETDDN